MSLWTIPWLCKYSRPSKSWQKYLRFKEKKKNKKPKNSGMIVLPLSTFTWQVNVESYTFSPTYDMKNSNLQKELNTTKHCLVNAIMLKVYSEAAVSLIICKDEKEKNRGLTRELEILETFSLEHCPTFPACHKRSTPLPYTYQKSQGGKKIPLRLSLITTGHVIVIELCNRYMTLYIAGWCF